MTLWVQETGPATHMAHDTLHLHLIHVPQELDSQELVAAAEQVAPQPGRCLLAPHT